MSRRRRPAPWKEPGNPYPMLKKALQKNLAAMAKVDTQAFARLTARERIEIGNYAVSAAESLREWAEVIEAAGSAAGPAAGVPKYATDDICRNVHPWNDLMR